MNHIQGLDIVYIHLSIVVKLSVNDITGFNLLLDKRRKHNINSIGSV